VRHVRMLGLCLAAVFAMSAMTLAVASPALASKCSEECKKEKEEKKLKELEQERFVPPGTESLKYYENCPVNNPKTELCEYASTSGGAAGGQFTVGPISVPLAKKIAIQFGVHENEATEELESIAPEDGAPVLVAPRLTVPGYPVAHISLSEQEELGWSAELKASYAKAKLKAGKMRAYEQLESAGLPRVNPTNLVFETGTGVEVPLKLKAENAWIESLGDECYVASEAEPIVQHLTTGSDTSPLTGTTLHGTAGELFIFDEGDALALDESNLVDDTFTVPAANCTGPNSEVIAATIDKVFGVPAVAGASVTELKGSLHEAVSEFIKDKGI
jgi:hypothetical protein